MAIETDRSNYRIFSIDCGTTNMGMVSMILDQGNRLFLEKMDWRPLIRSGPITSSTIAEGVSQYLTDISIPDPESPTKPSSPTTSSSASPISTASAAIIGQSLISMRKMPVHALSLTEGRPFSVRTLEAMSQSQVNRDENGFGSVLIPDLVLIEQQFVSMGKAKGTNYHALEIQLSLMSAMRERWPGVRIEIVAAAARKMGGVDNQKHRAYEVALHVVEKDHSGSRYWSNIFAHYTDPQHVSDAITMVLDHFQFISFAETKQEIDRRFPKIRRKPAAPKPRAKKKAAGAIPDDFEES